MKKLTLYTFFVLFCISGIYSQELQFSSLSNELQLPSQECYKIIQDNKGYIWFSTDNGLCRYGGNKLEVFNKKNGLPEENVYVIVEDKQGKLWFATSKNRILYYENGQLKEAPFNEGYQKIGNDFFKNPIPHSMDMNDPENSIITNSYYSVKVNQLTNKVLHIKSPTSHIYHLLKKKANAPFVPISRVAINESWQEAALHLENETQGKKILLPELNEKFIHKLILTALVENIDFIAAQNQLIRVNADLTHTVHTFPDRILSLYTDKSNGLWVGVLNNGVYYYPDVTTMQLGHHSLRKYSVSAICEDHEQGIWCTTLEKGVQYSRNKFLTSYTATEGLDRRISLLKYLDGDLYISSRGNQLSIRNSSGKLTTHKFPLGKETFFADILWFENHWVLSSKEIMVQTDRQFRFVKIHYSSNGLVAAYQLSRYKNKLYGIMYRDLYELDTASAVSLTTNFPFKSKSILHLGDGRFLLGGDQGLFRYDIKTGKYSQLKIISEKVTGLLKSRNGRIWVITADDDIYWIDGSKVIVTGEQLNLNKHTLYDITEDESGTIWVASNGGLYRFNKQENGSYTTSLYTIYNGLPSNEVYKVAADKEFIWFSTFEGLFSLPLNTNSTSSVAPSIHLQGMKINNQFSKASYSMELPYNQNDLHFTFDILTFKNGIQNKLIYSLNDGSKKKTLEVNSNEIFLENLSPGTYKLIVYGVNIDGVKSSQPEIFDIVITAPFWEAWWFITLITLLLTLGIVLLIRLIAGNIRKAEKAKTEVNKLMAEYQITALQAQMNPHFIFNSINTIQSYILEKNEEEAYNYLSKFGRLIRMVLHHSQEKTLALEKELEVLNLYILLEQLRFDHCFDYELIINDAIDTAGIYVPGMIIQPYVENAIWHGIVNLKGQRHGQLVVEIQKAKEFLLVSIKDNGVGREKAMSFRQNQRHKSVGMQLTGERLKVMNQLHGYETASVEVIDLFDALNEPAGTEVKIYIPIDIEL